MGTASGTLWATLAGPQPSLDYSSGGWPGSGQQLPGLSVEFCFQLQC